MVLTTRSGVFGFLFGIVMAIGSTVMKQIFSTGKPTPFLMELPSYKWLMLDPWLILGAGRYLWLEMVSL